MLTFFNISWGQHVSSSSLGSVPSVALRAISVRSGSRTRHIWCEPQLKPMRIKALQVQEGPLQVQGPLQRAADPEATVLVLYR